MDAINKLWRCPTNQPYIFAYDEIISFELQQDVESITEGGLGSAVVSRVLFGGVGALVGSSVGSKKTRQEISEYRIKVVTKNPCAPEIFINFLTAGKIKSGSFLCKAYSKDAQKVLSMLSIIANEAANASVPQNDSVNATDEIVKFKKLLDNGVITQEEFNAKKKQLLGI